MKRKTPAQILEEVKEQISAEESKKQAEKIFKK